MISVFKSAKSSQSEASIEVDEYFTSYISRQHASIEKLVHFEKGWYIKDGQWNSSDRIWKFSKNGTFVNSMQVNKNE